MLADLRERVVERALRLPAERVERAGRGDLLARVGDDVARGREAVVEALPAFAGARAHRRADVRRARARSTGGSRSPGCARVPVQIWRAALVPAARAARVRRRARRGGRARAGAAGGGRRRAHGPRARARATRAAARRRRARARRSTPRSARSAISTGFYSRLNGAELAGTAAVLVAGFLLVRAGSSRSAARPPGRCCSCGCSTSSTSCSDRRRRAARARRAGAARRASPTLEPPADPAGAAARPPTRASRVRAGRPRLRAGPRRPARRRPRARAGRARRARRRLRRRARRRSRRSSPGSTRRPPARSRSAACRSPRSGRRRRAARSGSSRRRSTCSPGRSPTTCGSRRPTPATHELEAALELVGALDWARALPDGLATRVGAGGVALTAAQAQQLALARLALADPPVAVLDEATAEAGSAGARVLEAAAERVLEGRTALVVAHRLTQAARADRIVVLDGGRVAEQGAHAELAAAGGPYAALWRAWSSGRAGEAALGRAPARPRRPRDGRSRSRRP